MTSFNLISFDIAFYIISVYYLPVTHFFDEIRDDDSKRLRINFQKVTNYFNVKYTHHWITIPYQSIGNTKSKHNDLNGHIRLVNLTLNSVPVSI